MQQTASELNLDYCLKTIDKDYELISNLQYLAQNDFINLYTAMNELSFSTMRATKGTDEEVKERFKALWRDDIKKIITNLKDNYFARPLDDELNDMPKLKQQAKNALPNNFRLFHGFCSR